MPNARVMTCVECAAVVERRGSWPREFKNRPEDGDAEPCSRCEQLVCEGHNTIHLIRCGSRVKYTVTSTRTRR